MTESNPSANISVYKLSDDVEKERERRKSFRIARYIKTLKGYGYNIEK
jgi:hypothetical protein